MQNKRIVEYAAAALMFLVLSFADFMGISSLGVGLLTALCALGLNAPLLSLFMILSGLFQFSWQSLTYNAVAGAVFSLLWLIGLKRKPKTYWYFIAAILAQSGLVVMSILLHQNAIAVAVSIFLSFIYAFLAYSLGVPIFKNRLRYKFLDSELISGGIIVASLAYGLARIPIGFPIAPFFFAIMVLAGSKVFGSGGLGVGLCFALGFAISDGTTLVGAFVLMSLTALIFIPAPRILSALSLVMSFIMYTFFFDIIPDNGWMWMASIVAGGVVYLLIPNSKIEVAKDFFRPDGRKVLRSMVNRNRVAAGLKLEAVSDVFGEMSMIMGDGAGRVSENHIAELTQSLVGSVCALCSRYEVCSHSCIMDGVGEVMAFSLESGRVTVPELPDIIKNNCISIAALISTSSQLASAYTERVAQLKNVNTAKKMVSSQLKGISEILTALAKKEAEPLRFDEEIEKKIAEELTYRTVVTSEVLVTGGSAPSVMLTVLSDTVNKDVIKSVLKKLLGMPFTVDKTENGSLSGWTVVYASAKPKFDVVFSVCGCPKDKNSVSGDTHSFIKIDAHRFMMAVCDGMGSGEKAEEFSTSTISLIENFYRAGFNHNLVLSSVNNFLSLSSEEIYSAVDIAVVDLENGICDIIKIGSPTSYIKTKDSVFKVDGSSLPIGVLEEMKPSIITYPLKGGETIVLTTDGAADSFEGDGLADVINNSVKLPEELCKRVVDAALNNTGEPCDDITVAAFHIFESI
ncbi:MAG: SpoIIE family protein phosphatase [Clostridiales bacterium]|nr:SpoIIE family protein phosphatase [Clostridiales bacterium]